MKLRIPLETNLTPANMPLGSSTSPLATDTWDEIHTRTGEGLKTTDRIHPYTSNPILLTESTQP